MYMHICTRTFTHARSCTHTRTDTHILAHICTRTRAPAHTRTFAHTDAHRRAHICTPRVHIHTLAHTDTLPHTFAHARGHLRTRTFAHTGTFTHRCTLAHTPLSLWSTRPTPCPSHPVQLICAHRPCSHAPLGSLGRWGAQEGTFPRLRPPPCWLTPGSLGGRGRGVGAPFFGTGIRPRSALRSAPRQQPRVPLTPLTLNGGVLAHPSRPCLPCLS